MAHQRRYPRRVNPYFKANQCRHPGCTEEGIPCAMDWEDRDPDFYCSKHAPEHGHCHCCGQFWGGIESFEFGRSPGLCDNCRDQIEADSLDEPDDFDESDYYDHEDDFEDDDDPGQDGILIIGPDPREES